MNSLCTHLHILSQQLFPFNQDLCIWREIPQQLGHQECGPRDVAHTGERVTIQAVFLPKEHDLKLVLEKQTH